MGTPTDPTPREQLANAALMLCEVAVAAVIFAAALVAWT